MKAVQFQEFGPPENMQYLSLEDPAAPTGSQVLIRAQAIGVNFHDNRQRLGMSTGATAPGIPGLELSGVVEQVGPEVTGLQVGDRVFGRARRSYAELVLAAEEDLFVMPEGVSFAEAAVIPVAFLTATHALLVKTELTPESTLLMQAAASSVGTAALQLAKWKGCWTAGTSASDAKLERLRADLGLDLGINYDTADVGQAIAEATEGRGVDVVMDGVGRTTINSSIAACARGGKVMVYGAASGSEDLEIKAGAIANKGMFIQGFSITQERELFRGRTMPTLRDTVLPLFTQGVLRPMLVDTLPLSEAVQAHRRILDRGVYGKLALIPDGAVR